MEGEISLIDIPEHISRSQFLIHTTTTEAAVAIAQEGKLRSPFSMLTDKSQPNAHLMQGGFRKFVASGAKTYIEEKYGDQTFQPQDIYKNITDNIERDAITQAVLSEFGQLNMNESFDWRSNSSHVTKALNNACEELHKQGFFGDKMLLGINRNEMWSWLHIFNTLPQEARESIATTEHIEQYISTSLGYSLPKYAPQDKTRQAAILLPIHALSISELQLIKNNSESIPLTEEELKKRQAHIENLDPTTRRNLQEAHFGGDIPEISIMKNEVDLTAIGASIILPKIKNTTQLSINLPIVEFDPESEDINSVIL